MNNCKTFPEEQKTNLPPHDDAICNKKTYASLSAHCYRGEIPEFVEENLIRLYGHPYSTLPYLRLFKGLDDANTYVTWQGDDVTNIILFKIEKKTAYVLNEIFLISEAEIVRFSGEVFSAWHEVTSIRFNDIETEIHSLGLPHKKYRSRQDYFLITPATKELYTASLGKATRRNIKRYSSKLLEDFPDVECNFCETNEIAASDIVVLLQMSAAKIASKKQRFCISAEYAENMILLANECGFVATLKIGERLIAGLLCYRTGDYILAHVVGHDPAFDAYSLGTYCYYLTICEAIERGVKVFNMGQPYYDYKARLMGQPLDLHRVELYRSAASMLRDPLPPLRMEVEKCKQRIKLLLLDRKSSLMTRCAMRTVYALHTLRHGRAR